MPRKNRLYILLTLLSAFTTKVFAGTSRLADTTIPSRITLQQFPITNLTALTDLSVKKDDPKLYYGKWQWTSNEQDSFTIYIQPNAGQLIRGGKAVKADVLCTYIIVRQGKRVAGYSTNYDRDRSPALISDGYTADKALLISPGEARLENLDGFYFIVFQFISETKELARLDKGNLIPFFATAFDKQQKPSTEKIPTDLILKKVSGTY